MRALPIIMIAALAAPAHAQESAAIRGTVHDAATGKPVPGASVYLQETDEVAITDDRGQFEFPPGFTGSAHLAVVDPSYQRADARGDGSRSIDIALAPVSLRGDEIVVEAEHEHASAGEASLRREEITNVAGARK